MDAQGSFQHIWRYLQANLHTGNVIKNWTMLKGYLGDTMTVAAVDEDCIIFKAPGAVHLQAASKDDFEVVWQNWQAYKGGRVKRYELREMTRYSKYIISTLHWLETQTSGNKREDHHA